MLYVCIENNIKKHLISLYTGAFREGIIKPINTHTHTESVQNNTHTHTESVQNTDEVIQSLTTYTESIRL